MTALPLSAPPHPQTATAPHEHAWILESRHATSEGWIAYVRCASCPARRVDAERPAPLPPVPLTRATIDARDPRIAPVRP